MKTLMSLALVGVRWQSPVYTRAPQRATCSSGTWRSGRGGCWWRGCQREPG
uniref:Uncharacterized protein n=1 Tax=Echeneis naucrates TaxID=173247 RepID=A0A665UVS3_ECHNA